MKEGIDLDKRRKRGNGTTHNSSHKKNLESPLKKDLKKALHKVKIGAESLLSKLPFISNGKVNARAGQGHGSSGRSNKNEIMKYATIGGFLILSIIVVFGTVWLFTNKNAQEVLLNDVKVGIFKYDKTMDSERFTKMAIEKLEKAEGGKIQTTDVIKLVPVHASKKEMVESDVILGEVYKKLTFKVEAKAIHVNDVEMVVVLNDEQAKEVQDNIKKAHIPEGKELVASFVENVVVVPKFVNKVEIQTTDKAYEILNKSFDNEEVYTVVKGDNLGKIAKANDTTIEKIYEMNQDLGGKPNIRIGQQIILNKPKPLLSVRTIETVEYIDVLPKEVTTIWTDKEKKTYSRVVTQGKDGQQKVIAEIERINGFETGEKKVVSSEITVPAVDEVIEKGTK